MPIHLVETSNGIFPELYGPTNGIRISRSYLLDINGWELSRLERLAKGYGLNDLILDIIREYIQEAKWEQPAPELGQAIDHEADERALTGRLPL